MTMPVDTYRCPAGKILQHYRRPFTTPRTGVSKDNLIRYRASMHDCAPCPLKPRCCPNAPARKVLGSIYEGARDLARADPWVEFRPSGPAGLDGRRL